MHWFDIFIIALIAAGFLYGFFKGIISEIFALAALVIGFIVALKFSFLFQPYLFTLVKKEPLALIVSFVVLFLVTAAIIIMLGIFFKKAIKFIRLSWLDRLIGGVFGIIKGIIVAGFISLLVLIFVPEGKQFLKKTMIGKRTITIVRIALYMLPDTLRKKLNQNKSI